MSQGEKKIIKEFNTTCPFPVFEYGRVEVTYNEVERASGIEYVLLVLLQRSLDTEERIVDVLKRFGIPKDLNYMFAKALERLISTGTVRASGNAGRYVNDANYFNEMTLGLFSLTDKGKKMFADGAVPTGDEKKNLATVAYRLATDEFSLTKQGKIGPKYGDCFLSSEDSLEFFWHKVPPMDDFIESVKTRIGLKPEEVIVKIREGEREMLVERKEGNLTVTIDEDGVEFSLENAKEQKFFCEHYSAEVMTHCLKEKTSYNFPMHVPTVNLEEQSFNALYLPRETKGVAGGKCELFLARGRIKGLENKAMTPKNSAELLDIIDKNAELALIGGGSCKYFLPLNFKMKRHGFDDCFEIHLLAERVADKDSYGKLMNALYGSIAGELSEDNMRLVSLISAETGSYEYLEGYTDSVLGTAKEDEDKIDALLKINRAFLKHPEWRAAFDGRSVELFRNFISSVEYNNVGYKRTVLEPLRRAMNMKDGEFVKRFFDVLRESVDEELAYSALDSAGFSLSDVLSVVNVIEIFSGRALSGKPIESQTDLAGSFTRLSGNLWRMCRMLGVDNPISYTLREDYDEEEFMICYATYSKAFDEVKNYSLYAKENYSELMRYDKILKAVFDQLSIEREAAKKPENITYEAISNIINGRGRLWEAICTLHIKAQYLLRILLRVDAGKFKADELINEAKKKHVIDADLADVLHTLRKCRNGLLHPEANQVEYDREKVIAWQNAVFSLEGGDK